MKTFALVIPLGLVGALFLATVMASSPTPRVARELPIPAPIVAPSLPASAPTAAAAQAPREIASLPRAVASLPWKAAAVITTPVPRFAPASLPTVTATAAPQLSPTPPPDRSSDREGCDPAYPDKRTCIPPGPPFDQGCAVTDERRFTVLPPDPQRLDYDNDGIGCEPMR